MKVTNDNAVQFAQDLMTSLKKMSEKTEQDEEKVNGTDQAGKFDSQSSLYEGLGQLKEAAANSGKDDSGLSSQIKCLKIMRRIMNGDRVPDKDRQFLAENAPDMLRQALLFRRPNPKPKDYESLLEEEKQDGEVEASDDAKQQLAADSLSVDTSGGAEMMAASEE